MRSPLIRLAPLAFGLFFAGQAGASDVHAHWAYQGDGSRWDRVSHDFEVCEAGKEQSPIDLTNATPAQLRDVKTNYKASPLFVINNGHTIQVNVKSDSFIMFEGERYNLVQYHFHTPSEHTINGKKSPMEAHLVHKGTISGKLTVLGVMMVAGKTSEVIEAIWDVMPSESSEERAVDATLLNPSALLPANRGYFRYEGSLTTPPCTEVVHWVNLKQPIEVSQSQIDRFAKLFPTNARPIHPLNRRFILETEGK